MAYDFDIHTGPELLGAHVLVGLTWVDRTGKTIKKGQFHGHVVCATASEGVVIVNSAGEELTLPPDSRAFEHADPGEYRLRATGEVVIDPDYLTTWTIEPPECH